MQIDAATRRNLELTRSLAGGREGSLLAAIDRTVTGGGGAAAGGAADRALDRRRGWSGARQARWRISPRRRGWRGPRASCCAGCPTSSGRCRGWRSTAAGRATSRRCATGWRRPARLHALLAGDLPEVLADGAGGAGRARGAGRRCSTRRWWPSRRCCCATAGSWRRGFDAELDETRRLRDEGRGVIAGLQADYVRQSGVARAEDPAQQRARLLHRDAGDPRRADAGAAAGRALRASPDHGERDPLHHAGAGRDRDEDPERRRPCAGDRAARSSSGCARRCSSAAGPIGGGGEGAGGDRRRGGAGRSGAGRGLGAAGGERATARSSVTGGRHPVVEQALRRTGGELRRQRLRARGRRARTRGRCGC